MLRFPHKVLVPAECAGLGASHEDRFEIIPELLSRHSNSVVRIAARSDFLALQSGLKQVIARSQNLSNGRRLLQHSDAPVIGLRHRVWIISMPESDLNARARALRNVDKYDFVFVGHQLADSPCQSIVIAAR